MDLLLDIDHDTDATVAGVAGEIDLSNASLLEHRLIGALDAGLPLIVDLSEVAYLDSSALACLHRVSLAAGDRSVPLRVVTGDQGMAKRLLAITGLDEVLRPWTTVAQAIASLSTDSSSP
jgi:anti-sigma B factor antagonist